MSLLDALTSDSSPVDIWLAVRGDGNRGSGTAADPYDGGLALGATTPVSLTRSNREVLALTPVAHGFPNGAVIELTGITGGQAAQWNGQYVIYDVETNSFKFTLRFLPAADPAGLPFVTLVRFLFDEVMRNAPANMRVNLGPGEFLTRGYGHQWGGGWQPKTGQKIVGQGFDVTTIKLLGAGVVKDEGGNLIEQHYHAIGMPVIPPVGSTTAITPLEHFEVSNLTIDCNLDGQPLRGATAQYSPVACGAIRVLGHRCRIRNVKTINWGTKSLKQGCFVISVIGASAAPSTGDPPHPILTEKEDNIIEDCIAIEPSRNCARETTVLHLGGVKNSTNHAQGFQRGGCIRNNFVDCCFYSPLTVFVKKQVPVADHFITSDVGTTVSGNLGFFVGKRTCGSPRRKNLRKNTMCSSRRRWGGLALKDNGTKTIEREFV